MATTNAFPSPASARASTSCTRRFMSSSQNNWNAAQVRRAKIVCTLGPASHSPTVIDHLMRAGMDVVRLNFSHGTQEEDASTIKLIRSASGHPHKPVSILVYRQGPKN